MLGRSHLQLFVEIQRAEAQMCIRDREFILTPSNNTSPEVGV